MSFVKENYGSSIILPMACCSISGCSSCSDKPNAATNLYNQTANTKEKNVGSGGGAS